MIHRKLYDVFNNIIPWNFKNLLITTIKVFYVLYFIHIDYTIIIMYYFFFFLLMLNKN